MLCSKICLWYRYDVPYVYTIEYAENVLKVPNSDSTQILSVIGILNTVGEVLVRHTLLRTFTILTQGRLAVRPAVGFLPRSLRGLHVRLRGGHRRPPTRLLLSTRPRPLSRLRLLHLSKLLVSCTAQPKPKLGFALLSGKKSPTQPPPRPTTSTSQGLE